jgi:hypothetical protein
MNGKKTIVVLQRGWVVVGDLTTNENNCTLTNASVVRRWGTSTGLGELANDGPKASSMLDPVPTGIHFDLRTSILMIPCNEANWTK